MNDRLLPWFILVPERDGITEIDELSEDDRIVLIKEIASASQVIRRLYRPDKINVGALGNVVQQLHVHIIGRFVNDRAWPGAIWGTGPIQPYTSAELEEVLVQIRTAFNGRVK
jgi:diadenosine tetraphosphate (Ap4A) HIT family hydrolase